MEREGCKYGQAESSDVTRESVEGWGKGNGGGGRGCSYIFGQARTKV